MVKESAGSQEQGKGNSSLLSKDRPEGGWKWKVGIALDMHFNIRHVEMERVCVSRARVCDKLLCYYVTLLWSLYLVFLRLQSAYDPQDMGEMLFFYFVLCFLRSSSPLTGKPPLVSDFWLIQGQSTWKSSWKFLPGGNNKTKTEYKWNQIIRNVRCEGAEDCKIIFVFYLVLHNQKSSLDSWGRGRAGGPVRETESDKKKPVIWNPTTLSCRLELSFEVSLVMLGSVSYATPDEK